MKQQRGLYFYRRKKKINMGIVKEIISWIFGIIVSIFLAAVFSYFFGMNIKNIGNSMEPEIHNGQTLFIDRFRYVLSTPKPGDVVAFLPYGNQNSHYYVKRVIAVGGDTVRIENGNLYVNEQEVMLDYDYIIEAGICENTLQLKNGEYFCVGDNINSSEDSRFANIGPVQEENIIGRVWLKKGSSWRKLSLID